MFGIHGVSAYNCARPRYQPGAAFSMVALTGSYAAIGATKVATEELRWAR
ncbi:hypothetical protein [[Mycobacterium] nativiensis]|uniref:Uncharacterized protein n=1 Tax=[Mycobacterium] nativiensis TaxID=2855503 RepID=A0ABU5Y2H9_9MYCO|nr:hypothetical protein [Mycolicibacter sp. MYC340]MEB3033110.1 hypothetical protein [Mycolicibacter sp. MYC340]